MSCKDGAWERCYPWGLIGNMLQEQPQFPITPFIVLLLDLNTNLGEGGICKLSNKEETKKVI